MPLVNGDVDQRPAGDHVDGVRLPPLGIVEVFHEMPPQAHHRLGGGPVPMDGQHRPRLDRIQHPLRPVLRGIPEIQIHPQPRRLLRPCGQFIQYMLIDNHLVISTERQRVEKSISCPGLRTRSCYSCTPAQSPSSCGRCPCCQTSSRYPRVRRFRARLRHSRTHGPAQS